MTVTSDWQVEYRGLLIDGGTYSLASVPQGLLGGVDVRTADQPRTARHGVVPGRDYLSGRSITLQVEIAAPGDSLGFNTAVAAFAQAFALGVDDAPLTFRIPGVAGGETGLVNARPRRLSLPVDLSYFHRIPIATVELYACDPYIHGAVATTTTIALPVAGGGFSFPFSFPLSFGASGTPTTVSVTNSGTAVAYPVVRIHGPITNPSLRNETTDQEVTVDLEVVASEWLDIDFQHRTVMLNGTANRYQFVSVAEWWGLQPGVNSIRFSATEFSAATAVMVHSPDWL